MLFLIIARCSSLLFILCLICASRICAVCIVHVCNAFQEGFADVDSHARTLVNMHRHTAKTGYRWRWNRMNWHWKPCHANMCMRMIHSDAVVGRAMHKRIGRIDRHIEICPWIERQKTCDVTNKYGTWSVSRHNHRWSALFSNPLPPSPSLLNRIRPQRWLNRISVWTTNGDRALFPTESPQMM